MKNLVLAKADSLYGLWSWIRNESHPSQHTDVCSSEVQGCMGCSLQHAEPSYHSQSLDELHSSL